MRLTQLHIKGFKSFADETIINFGEQVIGVVGPNGSGKSNIVDAIKWALGEQKTKELRLESMQDVIFNGTKDRKQGKVARVTVNFKNTKNILPTEYNDVSISRILYRNGQSEYRLNDVQCRKKDITSLFLDSGLGSNAYAIISLSMVEDILVDRENSRGRMIEEASGINKYKVRKRETLLKLKGTQADLDRVEDLLFELETNLKAFEKQARRTERYLKVKENFKTVSLSWAAKYSKQLNEDIGKLQITLNSEVKRQTELTADLNTKEAALQKVKQNVLAKEGQLSEFQRKHNQLKDTISSLENKKGIAQNERNYISADLISLEKSDEQLASELSRLTKELTLKDETKVKLESDLKKLDEEYQGRVHSYDAVKEVYDAIRENLISGQRQRKELSSQIENTRRDISVKQSQISLLEEQYLTKEREEEESKTRIEHLEEKLDTFDKSYNELKLKIEITLNSLTSDRSEKEALETVMDQAKEDRRRTELKSEKTKQRIDLLENVINNYEGFTESIQYLNSENKLKHSVVTDILEIKDEQYQEIVEMYFSSYLQHVIVDDISTAYDLNNIVRSAQKGKINFLIGNDISEKKSAFENDKFIPLASILEYNSEDKNIIMSLSSSAYIYNGTLNELLKEEISKDVNYLLPKEQLIYNSDELKGGSVTLFEGVNIGRKKNLKKLKDEEAKLIEKLSIDLQTIQNHSTVLGEIDGKIKEKEDLLTEQKLTEHKKAKERNIIEADLEIQLRHQSENVEKNSKAKLHIANIKQELVALEKLSASFSTDNIEENKLDTMRADFDKYHIDFEKARESKERLNEQILQERNKLDFMQRDVDIINGRIDEKSLQKKSNLEKKSINTERLVEIEKNLASIEKEVLSLYENEKSQFEKLNSQEEEYFSSKSGIYDQEKDIYELRGKRDKLGHLITNVKDKLSEKNQQLISWRDRIEVEFNEKIENYKVHEKYVDIPLDNLAQERENLQLRLRGFGDINPLAIEAYNEIKIRVEKIVSERDDILEAKNNLEETIDDIEKTASDLFTDSLDKIRHHFKDVFRSLFSEGDDCDIVLLNADKPLESSIEIVAKPKGKKPKSINQLSGGEKTLTAVSFLFALYLLKPAPFCIFDEVDAPLDDVNIQKFNKIIRTFSNDSQFIIVTHNKATMAEMDILYGVFMREHGVSGVAAVDFREFDKIDLFKQSVLNVN